MVKIFQVIVRGDYKLLNILSYALKYNITYIAVIYYVHTVAVIYYAYT